MKHLIELRKQKGYSQKKLADILGINQTAISQWERGVTTPSPNLILKLSELYNVTTDYLLGKTEEENKRLPSIDDRLNGLTDEQLELVKMLSLLDDETRSLAVAQIQLFLDHAKKNKQ